MKCYLSSNCRLKYDTVLWLSSCTWPLDICWHQISSQVTWQPGCMEIQIQAIQGNNQLLIWSWVENRETFKIKGRTLWRAVANPLRNWLMVQLKSCSVAEWDDGSVIHSRYPGLNLGKDKKYLCSVWMQMWRMLTLEHYLLIQIYIGNSAGSNWACFQKSLSKSCMWRGTI
jgi:hypothetical protein